MLSATKQLECWFVELKTDRFYQRPQLLDYGTDTSRKELQTTDQARGEISPDYTQQYAKKVLNKKCNSCCCRNRTII